jgi:hypothetical protein
MYARVASFEGVDEAEAQRFQEERMDTGQITPPEGVRRVMVLADRDGKRRLFITLFDSREAIEAAEAGFESLGDEIPEEIRGRRTSVDVYEVVMDREAAAVS